MSTSTKLFGNTVLVIADTQAHRAEIITDPGEWEGHVSPNLQDALTWLQGTAGPTWEKAVTFDEYSVAADDGERLHDGYFMKW